MKIFLVYLVIDSPQNTGYNYGLGYIASVLKEGGHQIDSIVLKNKKDIFEFYEKVKNDNPKIIGFSTTTSQFYFLKSICKELKKISDSFIVCGGVHPTLKPECIQEIPELDAIVRGEGEYPMFELASALENQKEFKDIKNFWFNTQGKIIKNEVRPLISDLDELPFPDKDSLDYQKIIDEANGANRFIFSRGCPFNCTYCSNKALSEVYPDPEHYFRLISPRRAIEEIKRDVEKYKFRYLVFDDDTISLNKKWFFEFFNLYKENFDYPFRCNLRVGTVDSDMMKLLKRAGAQGIGIGIEHGNEEFRKKILKRNITDEQMMDLFRLCNKHGIAHTDFMMVGLPFETKELFLDTVRFCRKVSARGNANIFQPYPGTELSDICEENDWLPEKDRFKERKEAVISYPNFSKREIQLCHNAFPYLLRYKFIPLKTPLWLVWYTFKTLKIIKNIILFVPRKLKK